jgi:hypothetical protein
MLSAVHLPRVAAPKAAYTQADQLMPGSRVILNGLLECVMEFGDLTAAKCAAKQLSELFPAEAGGWATLAPQANQFIDGFVPDDAD